jgi:hypothetical protein
MTSAPSWSLRGQTILLVGGPVSAEGHRKIDGPADAHDDEADVRVEEAIVTLSRGVFGRGGRILAPEHPLLTPLLLEITLEYWEALPGEESSEARGHRRFLDAPLLVYKRPAESGRVEHVAGDLERAARIGCVRFVDDEQLDSLPITLVVCIGGEGELADELAPFSRVLRELHNKQGPPVYVIPSTGGAASRTAAAGDSFAVLDLENSIVRTVKARGEEMRFELPDELRALEEERERRREGIQEERPIEPEPVPDFQYAIYPLLIAAILDEAR